MDVPDEWLDQMRDALRSAGEVAEPDPAVFDFAIGRLRVAAAETGQRHQPLRSHLWRRAGVIAAAAAAVAAVLLVPTVTGGEHGPLASASAAEFLQHAAESVASVPVVKGPYWHVRYRLSALQLGSGGGSLTDRALIVDEWIGQDNTRLISLDGRKPAVVCAMNAPHGCVNSPLPLRFDPGWSMLKTVAWLLAGPAIRDAKLQALFDMAIREQSVRLLGKGQDEQGRVGTRLQEEGSFGVVTELLVAGDGRPLQLTVFTGQATPAADLPAQVPGLASAPGQRPLTMTVPAATVLERVTFVSYGPAAFVAQS